MQSEPSSYDLEAVAARGYLQLTFPDAPDSLHNGEVSTYLKDGTWLANNPPFLSLEQIGSGRGQSPAGRCIECDPAGSRFSGY